MGVGGDSLEGLAWVLGQMRAAIEKPVLTDKDFPIFGTLDADTEDDYD